MAEALFRRSALENLLRPGRFGAIDDDASPSIRFSECRDLTIIQVVCWDDTPKEVLSVLGNFSGTAVTGAPQEASGTGPIRICWISDRRWLLISRENPSLLGLQEGVVVEGLVGTVIHVERDFADQGFLEFQPLGFGVGPQCARDVVFKKNDLGHEVHLFIQASGEGSDARKTLPYV